MLSLGALAGLAACPSGATKQPVKVVPPRPPAEVKIELPSIPAKIEVTTSAPMEGNAPAKKSPIIDILKAENEREMESLRKRQDPTYYLGYQLVAHSSAGCSGRRWTPVPAAGRHSG